jgi:hypothetical protein
MPLHRRDPDRVAGRNPGSQIMSVTGARKVVLQDACVCMSVVVKFYEGKEGGSTQ